MALVACGLFASSPVLAQHDDHGKGNSQETELKAKLMGPAILNTKPKGEAEFSQETENGVVKSKLQVEAEKVKLADGSVLTVKINGTAIGILTLKRGKGKFKLSTERGDTVPAVQSGDVLCLADASGNVILSGTF